MVVTKNVTHLGDYALYGCSKLEKVKFEDGSMLRSIGRGAFIGCEKLEEMKLPSSLETLGGAAFSG